MPGVSGTLRQKQVMIPGGGKTFIVTCTASAETFDLYQPTFEGVLSNFQVPAPVTRGFDGKQGEEMAFVWGVIAGVVGVLAWTMWRLLSKARAKQRNNSNSDSGNL
jgi:hypothetical protein